MDEEAVLDSLHKLVDKYEANSKYPISIDDFSKKTMCQIKGIVGLQIKIDKIQTAYKLSQGLEHDHSKIISELEEQKTPLGNEMA